MQGYPNKTLKLFKIYLNFSFRTKFFSLFRNFRFQAFLVSKTKIFIHVEKNLHKIAMPDKSSYLVVHEVLVSC